MPNSEAPGPQSPDPKPNPERPPGRSNKRNDKNPSGNLFVYLIIAGVIAIMVYPFLSEPKKGKELTLSEFKAGLRDGKTFDKTNVYQLRIGDRYVTFQDQKQSETETDRDAAKATKYFYIPAVGLADSVQDDLIRLLEEKEIPYGYNEPRSEWPSLLSLLAMPLLLLLVLIFIFRRIGGAGTAMSFGRSRGKLYAQEDVKITFHDVAGIEEAVEELREVVEFLRTPGKYQALGGRIPRGVLLVGPPGTGKTLLAKAVAGEAGVPFFGLSGSDFVEMFVGVGAARVRDMFQQAGQRSPAIIFIDELDALGKVRGSGMPGGHDEREQTLNALLVEMDGFSSDQSVIVMAATNRPETLDPALMRPGRFDRHVLVDRPDVRGREAILKVHATKIKMDDSVDLSRVAKLTPGFVGADLANLVNEAALLAARGDKKQVTMYEFEEGIDRVVAGLEKQTRIIHEDEKQRVAYHESGHALVACALPNTDPVHKISIIPRGLGALGYTMQRPEDERFLITQSELQSRICVLLGGIAAEQIIFSETSTGAQNDLQRATDIARRMVTEFGMSPKLGRVHYSETRRSPFLTNAAMPSEPPHSEDTIREIDLEVKRIIDEAARSAVEILTEKRAILEHITRELLEVEVMNSDHLKRILDAHQTSPRIKPGTYATTPTAGKDDEDPDTEEDGTQTRESADGA